MSFIISEKQYLASENKRSMYIPFRCGGEFCDVIDLDIRFGHPLYAFISDIFAIKCRDKGPVMFPVIPDGCMSVAFFGQEDNMSAKICGAIDEIKKVEMYQDDILLIIRFLPGSNYSFLSGNAGDLTNMTYDIKDYVKNGTQIASAANRDMPLEEKTLLLSKLIRIRMSDEDASYLVRYCTDKIFEKQGNVRVAQLAMDTGYSERYLGKVFEKYVGISPKIYCEIIRLQMSLKKISESSNEDLLVDIALDSGFFDHAHMNRCYRRFLHSSSGMLRKHGFSKLDFNKIDSYLYTES